MNPQEPQQPPATIPPVQTQSVQEQPVAPSTVAAPVQDVNLQKKIKTIGRSTIVVGAFFLVFGGLALTSLFSVTDVTLATKVFVVLLVLFSAYWIIAGLKIRSHSANVSMALKTIKTVAIVSSIFVAIAILSIPLRGKLGAGDIVIVLVVYLWVSYSSLKKHAGL
jgi:hypothetical protein